MIAAKNDRTGRSVFIDLLKTAAIISVVLYHFEFFKYGYLGVDIFLVIAGYLVGKSIKKSRENGSFGYFGFLYKRIIRLLPLILIAVTVCLVAGYFLMLPDDYENLAESVIATNFFSNNILQCITTKNYWDVVNNFKPLMHTWYVGVLFEAYIIIPLIPFVVYKAAKNKETENKMTASILIFISAVSLVLYLFPRFSAAYKFYMIPFRLFEVGFGCAVAYLGFEKHKIKNKKISYAAIIALLLLTCAMFIRFIPISDNVRLLTVVFSVCAMTALYDASSESLFSCRITKYVSCIGKTSFSIYVWHQIIIAFFRYSFSTKPTVIQYIIIFMIVGVISALSYFFVEKQSFGLLDKKRRFIPIIVFAAVLIITTAFSGLMYLRAGVTRDVPELEISAQNVQRGMHKKYNDAVYDMRVPFSDDDNTKVLVIGDSFARDWVNILKESGIKDIEISYYYYTNAKNKLDCADMIERADVIFLALFSDFDKLPEELETRYEQNDVYVIGVKNFGDSNGIIYKNRGNADYYNQTICINNNYIIRNERQKLQYKDQYIDMLEPVISDGNNVIVFTADGKFISQDCRHLTHAGAVFYSKKLDLEWISGKGAEQ